MRPWWETEEGQNQKLYGDIPGMRQAGIWSQNNQARPVSWTNSPQFADPSTYIYRPMAQTPFMVAGGRQDNFAAQPKQPEVQAPQPNQPQRDPIAEHYQNQMMAAATRGINQPLDIENAEYQRFLGINRRNRARSTDILGRRTFNAGPAPMMDSERRAWEQGRPYLETYTPYIPQSEVGKVAVASKMAVADAGGGGGGRGGIAVRRENTYRGIGERRGRAGANRNSKVSGQQSLAAFREQLKAQGFTDEEIDQFYYNRGIK